MSMRLLLISNSTMAGEPYLEYPKLEIRNFLGRRPLKIVFIPFAAVTFSYDAYEEKVNNRFAEIGQSVISIHRYPAMHEAIEEADAIVVGGGNTWQLVRLMHQNSLFDVIRRKVQLGTPYVGWSAGSNVACPTLRTTNDMPIVDPLSFETLNLIPFQINPHYLDANPDGHAGETREQRIEEFIEVNPEVYVAGLREGCMLKVEGKSMTLIGERSLRIFKKGNLPVELSSSDDLSFLLR